MINNVSKLKDFSIRNKVTLYTVPIGFLAFIPLYVNGITEPAIRYSGLAFQLLGIGTVIWGILETRKFFGRPPIINLSKCITKAKSLLGIRHNYKEYSCSGNAQSALNIYGPHETYEPLAYEPGANHTIDTLAEALKENVNSIHERISQTQKGIDKEFEKTNGHLKREEQSRQTGDNAIQEKLAMTSMGGFHISVIGAVFLFLGAILGTASNEIYQLYSKSGANNALHPELNLIPGINIHFT